MRISPLLRLGITLAGVALIVLAFVGVIVLGSINNPPPLRIAVAAKDLAQGERLDVKDIRVVEQILDVNLAKLYVQEAELADYANATVADIVRRGDPLNKIKLTTGKSDNKRYALALSDANDVVISLPVNPDIIPSKISVGDWLNITLVIGAEGSVSQLPDPTQSAATPVFGTPAIPKAQSTPSITPTPQLALPIADLLLERVSVLDVVFEQVQNPSASSLGLSSTQTNTEPALINGPIRAVVVRVPKGYQTLLSFAASAGKLRYSIASPLLKPDSMQPHGVVDWKRVVDLLRWKEQMALERGESISQTLYPK